MTNRISIPGINVQGSAPSSVVRLVRWYEKSGDQLLGELTLQDISLTELQTLFGESAANPMYDSYPISISQASHLEQKLNQQFDLDQYSYYLECDAVAESKKMG